MKISMLSIIFLGMTVMGSGCEQEDVTTTVKSNQDSPRQEKPLPASEKDEVSRIATLPYEIDIEEGQQVYNQVCATCHNEGIAGAPEIGDREAWKPRIHKGMEALVTNAINGFQGNTGVMPPRGGASNLSDQQVASAVAYIVQESDTE